MVKAGAGDRSAHLLAQICSVKVKGSHQPLMVGLAYLECLFVFRRGRLAMVSSLAIRPWSRVHEVIAS